MPNVILGVYGTVSVDVPEQDGDPKEHAADIFFANIAAYANELELELIAFDKYAGTEVK